MSMGASYRTKCFIVTADDPETAVAAANAAEAGRKAMAMQWFGRELPPWREACPVRVREGAHLGVTGRTSFTFDRGQPVGWEIEVQGPLKQILQSVLPHEVAHAVFATHFGRPLPRWVEEGICVLVEDESSQAKLRLMAASTLRSGNSIPLDKMFTMEEYPRDVLRFYSQGYSLTSFLIEHGGKSKLIQFITDGIGTNDWNAAAWKHYGYKELGDLHHDWVAWVFSTDV
jgi:hypothetical protein